MMPFPYAPPLLSPVSRLRLAHKLCSRRLDEDLFYINQASRLGRDPSPYRLSDYLSTLRLLARWETELEELGARPLTPE